MVDFVKEHILYRFGIPQTITTDQGAMFISKEFENFATNVGFKLLHLGQWTSRGVQSDADQVDHEEDN